MVIQLSFQRVQNPVNPSDLENMAKILVGYHFVMKIQFLEFRFIENLVRVGIEIIGCGGYICMP